jgi:hypothetical protein
MEKYNSLPKVCECMSVSGGLNDIDIPAEQIVQCIEQHESPALSKHDLIGSLAITQHQLDRALWYLTQHGLVEVHDTGHALIFYVSESAESD